MTIELGEIKQKPSFRADLMTTQEKCNLRIKELDTSET